MTVSGPVFVDTWGWLALGYRKDPRHREVSRLYQELLARGTLVYTSDYVLDEIITLLFRREVFDEALRFTEAILASAAGGHIRVERITPERFTAAWDLRRRFRDKPLISFTDLASMVVMQELEIEQVITGDRHFLQVGMGFQLWPASLDQSGMED